MGEAGTEATQTTVVEVDPVRDPRWDAMVREHRHAASYHLGAWAQILSSAYGGRPCYLGLEAADRRLLGGVPIIRTRGPVTGTRMRTLPVVPPAGVLADSDESMRRILDTAFERTEREGAKVWVLHSRQGALTNVAPELRERAKPPTWVRPLGDDPDEVRAGWKKTSKQVFRGIKKAEKAGVTVREAASVADVRAFYRLYARTMRRRRVLPRSLRQLTAAFELLPDGVMRLHLAEYEGQIVAGALWHSFRDTLDLLYNGSDERQLDCRPNHALYWHALRWATESGHTELDFGAAQPGSGLADFKAQWGAEEVPEYRFDYAPGATGGGGGGAASDPVPSTGSNLVDGRSNTSLAARAIERTPVRVLSAAGRLGFRL